MKFLLTLSFSIIVIMKNTEKIYAIDSQQNIQNITIEIANLNQKLATVNEQLKRSEELFKSIALNIPKSLI